MHKNKIKHEGFCNTSKNSQTLIFLIQIASYHQVQLIGILFLNNLHQKSISKAFHISRPTFHQRNHNTYLIMQTSLQLSTRTAVYKTINHLPTPKILAERAQKAFDGYSGTTCLVRTFKQLIGYRVIKGNYNF